MSSFPFHRGFRPGLLFLCLFAAPCPAGEAPALALPDALARALERNPVLAAQRFDERVSAGLIEQAALRPNPELNANLEHFAGTGAVSGVRQLETTLQASQTFERGGKRGKRVALAERERDVAIQEFAVRRAEILVSVADAYVALLAAQARQALAAEPLRLARETVAVTDRRVQAASASAAESARSRVLLAAAQAEATRAQTAVMTARAALAATWAGLPGELTRVVGTLRVPETLPDEGAVLARIASHPRLALQQAGIAVRRAALELAEVEAIQDVTAGGGVRFFRDGSEAAFVAGVSMPIPTRNRNQGNIRAAREQLAGAEQSLRATETGLRSEFQVAWQTLAGAHTSVIQLRRDALPAAEEADTAVRRAYEGGLLSLLDVLDAQRAVNATRRDLLESEAAYVAAFARVTALADLSFTALTALLGGP